MEAEEEKGFGDRFTSYASEFQMQLLYAVKRVCTLTLILFPPFLAHRLSGIVIRVCKMIRSRVDSGEDADRMDRTG